MAKKGDSLLNRNPQKGENILPKIGLLNRNPRKGEDFLPKIG